MRRIVLLLASMATALLLASGVALTYPGDLDASFSADGRLTTNFAAPDEPQNESAYAIVVQPDERVVVVGGAHGVNRYATPPVLAMARYNPDGSLDSSFSSDGKVTDGNLSTVVDAALQSDGKIVVLAGNKVVRYNSDGSLDTSFGTGGTVTVTFGATNESENASALVVQSDDKILVAGSVQWSDATSSYRRFALARYDGIAIHRSS